jgi:hypothetical protein
MLSLNLGCSLIPAATQKTTYSSYSWSNAVTRRTTRLSDVIRLLPPADTAPVHLPRVRHQTFPRFCARRKISHVGSTVLVAISSRQIRPPRALVKKVASGEA